MKGFGGIDHILPGEDETDLPDSERLLPTDDLLLGRKFFQKRKRFFFAGTKNRMKINFFWEKKKQRAFFFSKKKKLSQKSCSSWCQIAFFWKRKISFSWKTICRSWKTPQTFTIKGHRGDASRRGRGGVGWVVEGGHDYDDTSVKVACLDVQTMVHWQWTVGAQSLQPNAAHPSLQTQAKSQSHLESQSRSLGIPPHQW